MGNIQVMPDALANQIAAGEVVERPASCVKELLENSLDAGAAHVWVALEDGGISRITVQDDGHGMDGGDAALAFARHATSKVHSARDLFKIATLGFRGEALASVAAVARVSLQTRRPDAEAGVEVRVEGSVQAAPAAPIGIPHGTRIDVRDLFFNTPARLKYLRSVSTEQARCIDVVQQAALARPDVAFHLEANGQLVFQSAGRGRPVDAAAAVFGAGEARQLLSVQAETADYRLTGLIGRPTQSKSTRAHAYLFINRRPIRNFPLHQAVLAGYGSRLMTKRHPIYALYLDMDPILVDVNIHPHKAEVRFSEERDVARLLQDAVQQALDSAFLIPTVHIRANDAPLPSVQSRLQFTPPARTQVREQGPVASGRQRQVTAPYGVTNETAAALEMAAAALAPVDVESAEPPRTEVSRGADREVPVEQPAVVKHALELRPVGQTLGMYIVADDGETLYIIDQHAAHERVLYERFRDQVRARTGNRVTLLTPLPMRLTPAEYSAVTDHQAALLNLGFDIEPFGGTDVVVRSVPEVWEGLDHAALTEQLIASLIEDRLPVDASESLRERVVMNACKSAIKANHRLSTVEMEALCGALAQLEDPFHCPHGRPVLIQLTSRDLEKAFRRIV